MPVRVMDPADPAFPHGARSGYKKGCRASYPCPASPTCRQLELARREERARNADVPFRYRADSIRAHLKRLIDDDWTPVAIADAVGLHRTTVKAILRGSSTVLSRRTATLLADLTYDDLLEGDSAYVPRREGAWRIGSLMAAGHSIPTLAALLGRECPLLRRLVSGRAAYLRRAAYEDIALLHERMARTPGTNDHARRRAALLGYRTPDAYAPDGKLWDEDVRDEAREARWMRRDREALLHMQVARLSVVCGMTGNEVIAELGLDDPRQVRAMWRARKSLGLKWTGGRASRLEEGQQERIAKIVEVVERWRMAGPLQDPHPYCVELGMMDAPVWTLLDGKPRLEAA